MASNTLSKKKTTRLCDLPDEILIKILSLLPTKFAVTTSLLLSRRWHYLWTSITNLKIRHDMFKGSSKFINFMDRAMVVRKGSFLESFSLRCRIWSDDIIASRVNAWITSAIQCNVAKLDLLLNTQFVNRALLLPVCLFDCRSLEKLDLTVKHYILRVPSSSTSVFSNLKSLRLCGVIFADDESAQKLFSSPLLEELIIRICYWGKVRAISVSTPNLKVLDIEDYTYETINPVLNRKVCFVADNLWSFRYKGSLYNEYQICASSSSRLSTVEIYVKHGFHKDIVVYANRCLKLINGLSKAHSLTLTENFLWALINIRDRLDKMHVFQCLTRLNLNYDSYTISIYSIILMEIFKRCPHLERLDIAEISDVVMVPLLSHAPTCFQTRLKRIYIATYRSYYAEKRDAISALLNSCAVLEIMVINRLLVHERYGGSMNIEELQNELNRRPRVSKDCRIILKDVDYTKAKIVK